MIKYILHGGYTSNPSESNKQFYAEMVPDLERPVSLLLVYFSRKREEWQQLFEQDKKHFLERATFKAPPEFILADDNPEKFIEQVKSADTIYMRGGGEFHLIEFMKGIKNTKELFEGKIISGSSMGAYAISKYYYSNDEDKFKEGAGILPIKAFAHYDESKLDKLKKLKDFGEDLKVYTIPDEQFVIIEE